MSECAGDLVRGHALTGTVAASAAINRVKRVMTNMFATGDDDGVVKVGLSFSAACILDLTPLKLWDPRKPEAIRAYTHHFDFISDFLWLEDKKHLVCARLVSMPMELRSSSRQLNCLLAETVRCR